MRSKEKEEKAKAMAVGYWFNDIGGFINPVQLYDWMMEVEDEDESVYPLGVTPTEAHGDIWPCNAAEQLSCLKYDFKKAIEEGWSMACKELEKSYEECV